jgi:hypothetical protein
VPQLQHQDVSSMSLMPHVGAATCCVQAAI